MTWLKTRKAFETSLRPGPQPLTFSGLPRCKAFPKASVVLF